MSEEKSVAVGSPDSGVEESLSSSIARMILEEEVEEEPAIDVKSNEKEDQRRNSVSSEGTSTTDDRDSINANLTQAERVTVVRELLETYFSDNYLTRDIFLLKHFRKSKEGWISLKFMASYKRIKRTTKYINEVEEAVKQSSLLELNAERNKVRRLAPLPACIEDYIPTRMTLIACLPESLRSLTALSKFVGVYGEVASIQILRPGVNLPDFLWETVGNFPQVREQWCAVVEFDEMTAAGQCASAITGGEKVGASMWATELVMPWRNRKNSDRIETWADSMKNRCRSLPSSGYSSPIQTPEQSPSFLGTNREVRGITKRERITMNRSKTNRCCHSFACQHQIQYPPCQHLSFSQTCSPNAHKKYAYQRQGDCACRFSPKRYVSQATTGSNCDNWRMAPAAQ